jgi:DNA primase
MDVAAVSQAVAQAGSTKRPAPSVDNTVADAPQSRMRQTPDSRRVEHRVEREALKAVMQYPRLAAAWYAIVEDAAYTFEPYRAVHQAVYATLLSLDIEELSDQAWIEAVMASAPDDEVRTAISAVLVEPLAANAGESIERYVTSVVAKLQELDAIRRIADLRGQLQRTSEEDLEHGALFNQLLAMESHRRTLANHARGV